MSDSVIRIRGARTHNLRDVDVDLPHGRLIVMTGVSGSGKSSLAFDTLFAEGQRRYLESVSVHTRGLLRQLPRPDVDEVSGLPPTVSVDQRVTTAPARSTLAVTTEIYDYLRLLYARAGTAHCTSCGNVVESQSVDQILHRITSLPERTRLMVLSPMVRARKGAQKEVLEKISRNGFVRVRVDGHILDVNDVPELAASREHTIDAVIDRIIWKDGVQQRLRDSIELAVRESDGTCIICDQTGEEWRDRLFSTRFSCADCDLSFPAPESRTFSFNSVWGACQECHGFGIQGLTEEVDDVTVFRSQPCRVCCGSRLQPFASGVTFLETRIADFTALTVEAALEKTEEWTRSVASLNHEAQLVAGKTLPDIRRRLECLKKVGVGYLALNRPTRTLSGGEFQRARLSACLGTGLHGACFVLDEPTAGLHPRDTHLLLQTLLEIRDSGATVVVVEHDGEMMRAADCLIDLGPGAGTEGGRLLFAGSPDDALAMDTPTGNYLRVEHKRSRNNAVISGSKNQRIPGAGRVQEPESFQATAFSQQTTSQQDPISPGGSVTSFLTIRNARRNNLRNVTVEIPLQKLVCISGVSGSGKTSLIMETLYPIASAFLNRHKNISMAVADADCDGIDGLDQIQRLVAVDHSPLGRNRRSCIATYSKLWGEIRKVFAKTREARARGYTAQRFSFNSGEGRCAACKGTGVKDIRMSFLPDASVTCPECVGRRFNRATQAVRFAGASVVDILNMRVDQARDFFREFSTLRTVLNTFHDVGLGYLTLGQPAATFSGGEAQRVRLATELAENKTDRTLYILDEPTSGLHPADVCHLLALLKNLSTAGHSVVIVEHNPDVIRASDWIIDIGPESAQWGGKIIAQGTPEKIAGSADSVTGQFLRSGRSGL